MGTTGDAEAIACGLRVCPQSGSVTATGASMPMPYSYAPGETVSIANGDHTGTPTDHWHASQAGNVPGLKIEVVEVGGTPPISGDTEVNRGFAEFTLLQRLAVTSATLKFRVFDVSTISIIPVGGLFGQENPLAEDVAIRAYDGDGTLALTDYNATPIGAKVTFNPTGASAQDDYSIDITSMYNSWVSASVGLNFGVMFLVDAEPAFEEDAITFYDLRLVLDAATDIDLATRLTRALEQRLTIASANYRSADSSGSFTGWFKTHDTTGQVQWLFSSADSGALDQHYLRIGLDISGSIVVDTAISGSVDSVRTTATGFDDADWHHVQVVSSGTAWSIWVDGSSEALTVVSGANTGDWFADILNRDNVVIGGYFTSTGIEDTFNGDVDEFAIWSAQLTGTNASELVSTGGKRVLNSQIIDDSVVLTGGAKPVNSWALNEEATGGKGNDGSGSIDLVPTEQPNSAPPMQLDQT